MSNTLFKFPILAAALLALSGCGGANSVGTSSDAGVSQSPTTIVKGQSPVQLYSVIAQRIRACWFNPRDPVLTKHVFRAKAGAGGTSGSVTAIVIHERTKEQKRGLKAFSINFAALRDGTRIDMVNNKLPYALGQKLMSDVGYWSQGGPNCDGPQPASAPRGSVAAPR